MCMEDINIGRRTVGSTRSFLIASGQALSVPANGARVGLFLAIPADANYFLLTGNGVPASTEERNSRVLTIINGVVESRFFMRIEEFGTMVQQSFTLLNDSANPNVFSYTELILMG